ISKTFEAVIQRVAIGSDTAMPAYPAGEPAGYPHEAPSPWGSAPISRLRLPGIGIDVLLLPRTVDGSSPTRRPSTAKAVLREGSPRVHPQGMQALPYPIRSQPAIDR